MTDRQHLRVPTPLGDLLVVAEDGALIVTHLPGQDDHGRGTDPGTPLTNGPTSAALIAAREQLTEYFAGERATFELPLRPTGTAWQHQVWRALLDIPSGHTWTYGQLAAHLGRPTSSRAVGLANGRNPLGVIVPCHRVVGASGHLTGYAGGLPNKLWLLRHEGVAIDEAGRVCTPAS
ncbi:molybdenum cofactor biosynthesis protein MoaE [Platysternon megacephalum]|uniref:Methylated-DNA--protein-cysteine methyltransferase n=1 Tax=Platysternon megacephalum TaxID=55544 RepID=A0A4D9DCB8_9SAUR|nr:molybdenum cofactor biosynthesis protein MoaE [Platysternon megacephalum]